MKKIRFKFLFGLVFIAELAISQTDSALINTIEKYRKQEEYGMVIQLLEQKEPNDSNQLWFSYQLACYNSLNRNFDKAIEYLKDAIRLNAKPEEIIVDTDFDLLREYNGWKKIKDTLDKIFLSKYPNIKNPTLSIKLWRMGIADQQFRTLHKFYKKPFPEMGSDEFEVLSKKTTKAWHHRTDTVLFVIMKHGWPGYSMVGEKASEAAFLIMQHSDIKPMRKAYRKLKKAAFNGDASLINYAMMCDRVRILARFDIFKRKQIYGTQVLSERKMVDGKLKGVQQKLYPLKKPEEVDKRRAAVGLGPLKEYLKKWDIEFNVPQK